MPKIKVIIGEEEYITDAVIEDNLIKYTEENGTKTLLNTNNFILIRENNDIYMKYDFKNKKGNIKIKELDKEVSLDITNINIEKEDKIIEIKYNIEKDKFVYRLEVL